jgi:hypothetical protein
MVVKFCAIVDKGISLNLCMNQLYEKYQHGESVTM